MTFPSGDFRKALALVAGIAAGVSAANSTGGAPGGFAPKHVHLKVGAWDPVLEASAIPEELSYRADEEILNPYFLVQFHGVLSSEQRRNVEALGAKLLFYIHEHAYIVRMNPAVRHDLEVVPFARWVGPLQPGHKLDPEIGRREFKDPARRASGTVLSVVSVFPGEDAEAVAEQIRALNFTVFPVAESPSLRHIMVEAPSVAALHAVARIPAVQWIDEEGELVMRNTDAQWVAQTNVSGDKKLWTRGLLGQGQIVGVIDGYLYMDSCYFRDPVNNTPSPTHRKVVACRDCSGVSSHGTHVAGTVAGDREPIDGAITANGHAYKAKITFGDLDAVWSGNLYNYLVAAHNDGARIHTNSWGNDNTTTYDQRCVYIDQFSYDYETSAVLFAVTNGSALRNPENARNVLAVGATAKSPDQHNHCSGGAGPTADGRRKPEIYLPGCSTVSASSGSSCGTASLSGTSMASPAIAGSLALVQQYFAEGWHPSGVKGGSDAVIPSGALLRAMGLNSAVDMTGVSGYPSNQEGWGRMLLDNVLYFDGDVRRTVVYDVLNADGLSTNDIMEYPFTVEGSSEFLRVTLVYTDYPAALNASYVPVNDIDLELVAPSGTYKGNVFSGGVSATGGNFDTLNNVEQIHLNSPATGAYTARIIGRAVNQNLQGYALVITGDVATCPKPAAPTLSGSAASSTQVDLSWTSVPGADSYNVYRSSTSCTAGWSLLVNKTTTTHTDGGLTAGAAYYYVVRAVDNDCESLNSNCVTMLMAVSPAYDSRVIDDAACNGNGVPDPGESVVMAVTLRNDGALAATGVSATLSTTTPGITVTDNSATFPNLPGGGTTTSDAPHYAFAVDSGVSCGTFIDFTLAISAAEGNWNRAFQVMVGSGTGPTTETANQSSDLSLGKDTGGTRTFTPNLTPSAPVDSVVFTSPSVAGGSGEYQLHVVAPGGVSLQLKSCTAALAATYDITAFYNGGSGGPGQWSMCVSRGSATTCGSSCSANTGAPNTRTFSGAKIDLTHNPAVCEPAGCGACTAAASFTTSSPDCDAQTTSFTNTSTGAASYHWDFTNDGTFDSTATNPTNNYAPGTYTARLRAYESAGQTGCFTEATQTVVIEANPAASFTSTSPDCLGQSTSFTDTSTSDGARTWAWDFTNDGTTDSTATNPSFTYPSAATYTARLTITDSSTGCTSTTTQSVVINTNPTPTVTGDTSFCAGGSANLCAGAGYSSYLWNTGATTQCITVSTGGTYSVTVTDGNGCAGTSAGHTVTENPNPTPTIVETDNCAVDGTVTLDAGAGYSSYSWNTGATTRTIVVAGDGASYSVTVTDGNGCQGSDGHTTIVCPPVGDPPGEVPYAWWDADTLSWDAEPNADFYNVYRDSVMNLAAGAGNCLSENIVGTSWTEAQSPAAGATWFYLISAENSMGEGPLGADSASQQRVAATPCP